MTTTQLCQLPSCYSSTFNSWSGKSTAVIWLTTVLHVVGGELQRFAIAVVAAQAADIYMIDEPSSYLDVRQRLKAAQVTDQPNSNSQCLSECVGSNCMMLHLSFMGLRVQSLPTWPSISLLCKSLLCKSLYGLLQQGIWYMGLPVSLCIYRMPVLHLWVIFQNDI